jgi:hypothetical protein
MLLIWYLNTVYTQNTLECKQFRLTANNWNKKWQEKGHDLVCPKILLWWSLANAVSFRIMISWNMTTSDMVCAHWHSRGMHCLIFRIIPPQQRKLSMQLHKVTSHNTVLILSTTLCTWNDLLIKIKCIVTLATMLGILQNYVMHKQHNVNMRY